jgi:transposase
MEANVMLQITPHMRILVAVEPIDGRKGIDSLAQLCRQKLEEDPFSGVMFLFLTRSRKTLKALCYDGQGYFLAQKRLSEGRFKWWPTADTPGKALEAHQVQMLLAAGNPDTDCAPMWRRLSNH